MEQLPDQAGAGEAAFAVQFAIARELLRTGNALILEGAFFRRQREIVDLAEQAETFAVELHCPIDVLERRYVERIGQRHPGHRGLDALPDLRERVANDVYGVPPLAGPVLRVDTTEGMRPPETEVVEWVRSRGGERSASAAPRTSPHRSR